MKRKSVTAATKVAKKVAKSAAGENKSKKHGQISKTAQKETSPYFKGIQHNNRLKESFYNQDCVTLARDLLGKVLVRELNGERLSGKIVETEAYLGVEDSACHSYKGHRSKRNEAMWMNPGCVYVYLIYGMYFCINISSKGDGNAVLLRALEPLDGAADMETFRSKRRKSSKNLKHTALCSGPGKLTDALQITKEIFNKESLSSNTSLWIEDAPSIPLDDVVSCPRIGIDYATKDWKEKPLRYYIRGSRYISKRDKNAE